MWMVASATFDRGVNLEVDFTNSPEDVRVKIAASGGQIIGRSLDKANAIGDFVRVFISGVLADARLLA